MTNRRMFWCNHCTLLQMRILSIFSILLTVTFASSAQQYANPLDGELILSGNFGEVRGNHFHSGLDLKTGGSEGKPVYSIADGYVVRIAVSGEGFGKAIYVNHPDGKTSVYAHLRDFAPEIAAYVKEQQYANQSFEVDLEIPASKFPVKQGQVIAKSGNSGSSGGPHVHFEVRETAAQIPENPLNYGFKVRDQRHPELKKLWVYSHSEQGHVDGLLDEKDFKLSGASGNYKLGLDASSPNQVDTIHAFGPISFGVAAQDRFSSSDNVCGIYSMTVKVNGDILHQQQIDKFPFDKKRMVNCHVDYEKRVTEKQNVYRTYIAPENTLKLYPAIKNGGVTEIEKGKTYRVEVEVKDHAGNISRFVFVVLGSERKGSAVSATEQITDIFYPNRENSFSNHSLRVNIPNGCLYDTVKFKYDLKPACANCISAVHSIGKLSDTPLDKYMTVSIKLEKVSENTASKVVIVSFDKNNRPIAEGGSSQWNWITTKTRSFGDYAVMLDSLAPILKPKNFKDQTSTAGIDTLKFHLEDDLSGIRSISGTLNGKWVLLEHDPKNDLLFYVKDERFISGQNAIRITVKDKVGNVKELSVTVH